ncbi:Nuclear cap-binding protein subunit 1 [Folsomia candida]|uniref:Nuclear cap-binding protein subunit 1 n=1 Tax=Folsomia candida TaxID=158441 RepID=A0A226F4W9_FOLCA|nr:Nuclear cap-binding protein subunit 1 [Folsomia candida]
MNRRRRFEEVEGGDRNFKRRRTSSYNEKKEEDPIKSLICNAGDKKSASVETSIEEAAKMLENELATQKPKILATLVEVVTTLPEKYSIYSTLAGLLNAKNYNFGGEFVETLVKSFKEFLRNMNWRNCQYTVRFISDLVNCHVVSATSLLQLYDSFMEGAIDSAIPQVRRDWLVYSILYCLPCVGRELYDKKEQTVERLMITIDNYMKKRRRTHMGMLRVWSSDEPHPQEEYLDCLWAQVEKLKLDGWMEKHIARPYLAFDSILCEALQHNLQQISLPPHHDGIRYPIPSVVFRMFDYTDCPEGTMSPVLPGAHSIERFLIEEELRDILRKYHLERRDCAAALLEYPQNHRVPVEYMVVEILFGELFRLPTPEYLEICYGSILIELCKSQPAMMPQVLAQATELLFDRLDTMNVICIDRFANWFSYHLSNFQFRWSWTDWVYAMNFDAEHPKSKFISEVVQKCIRLSYHERIIEMIPQPFQRVFPERSTDPLYKFYEGDKVQQCKIT